MSVRTAANRFALDLKAMLGRAGLDRKGFAAVEFAMIVPVMITLFLGSVELSEALSVDRRVTSVSSATADLVAQSSSLSSSDLADISRISDSLMGRYGSQNLDLKIASLVADNNGVVTVDWSYDRNGGEPYTKGSAYPGLPSGLVDANGSIIVSEASFSYTPPIGHFIAGSITLKETFFLRPRLSVKVTKTD